MTLNLTIVTPKNVYQCSDFRLTYRGGTITDHEAQKIVPVVTWNWNALVQYTGVAKKGNFDTSQWLSGLPSQVVPRAPVEWLRDRLLEAGRKHIGVGVFGEHTFSVAGFEGERPFVTVVSNFQRFDATRLSLIPTSTRKWEVTTSVGRHGAFATGSAEHVMSDELRALPKFARSHRPIDVHRKLADLNQAAAQRAGVDGPISESCFTGQMSLDGGGTLMPHNVNPGGEYLPKFATNILTHGQRMKGVILKAKMDSDGNPLPRRLVQIAMKRKNVPIEAMMLIAEFQAMIDEPPGERERP